MIQSQIRHAEDAQRKLRNLSTDQPEGWRKDYVGIRNEYREAMEGATRLAEKELALKSPDLLDQFRGLRDTLFGSLGVHQSRWPVLIIGKEGSEEYRNSVKALEEKHTELVRFMRSHT